MVSLIRASTKNIHEKKWTDRQYHVYYNADVSQKDVKLIVTKICSQYYYFVVHIPNLMLQ